MNDFNFIDEELSLLEKSGLRREFKTVVTPGGPWVELASGKRVLQFSSNNYLGLANHPEIINTCKSMVSKYGTGSTGSRLLSGTTELHVNLEESIAKFEGAESAVFFSSGYAANVGVLSSVISKEDAVYSDELNHASIIDGIRLSGAKKLIYHHNDTEHLEFLIKENKSNFKRHFIVTDSVFSMDGDIAPLEKIGQLAKEHDCITFVDEAHATGIFGKGGLGIIEELNLKNFFPVRTGTCSKAFGVEGGFCVAPNNVAELIKNKARSFIFSTSTSPAVIGAVQKALELVIDGAWRRERLWQNAKLLYEGLKKNPKLKLNDFATQIIIVYFDSVEEALSVSDKLFSECHVWASAIRPPTVKQPRIRLTPIATHSQEDIKYVIRAFDYLSKDLSVKSEAAAT